MLTIAVLLPVGLLAASSIVLASHQVTSVVDKQVQTTAAVSSVVIGQHTTDLVNLVSSYAGQAPLAAAVAAGPAGDAAVEPILTNLAHAVPGISASFIASLAGTSLNTFPLEPSVIGTNFAYRDWYKGLVASGRPYVSNAIVTHEAGHPLAVTVTTYIDGSNGRPIAILGANYSLASIQSFTAHVGRAQGITLTVTDRVGTSLTKGASSLVSLASDPRVRAAQAGRSGVMNYAPVLPGGGRGAKQLSAYTPVAGTGWTVTASIPQSVAFAGLVRLRDGVLAVAALLALLLLGGVRVVARSSRRRGESEVEVRRRDRELLRVLESTDEGVVSIDATGAITAWNGRAEQLYGWAAPDVLGRNMVDTLIPLKYRAVFKKELAGYQAERGSAVIGKRLEMTTLHRDSHEIPVEVAFWVHDDGEGFSAFVHDTTERVAAQAELEAARDQAMQASLLKSEFLANMSHEIRTPMNGVIGMSGLLLETGLDVEQRDYAETIFSSAEALLTVIDDILDFSKIEAGKLNVESVTFDLPLVVEAAAALLAARAQHQGLELTCRIDPALPATVEGDPGRLRQVLLNLLGNAVKFTSQGEVNLTALVVGEDTDGRVMVELSVRDTGIGMTGATLGQLFDAFTQADTSTSRRYGGTGLGLAISRQLVELMGGTLRVASEPGRGSTFTAAIPFRTGAASPTMTETIALVGARVLIVDDNATNQGVLREMVAGWGCVAATAGGAAQAQAVLRQAVAEALPLDVVVLDQNMPDVDGHGLARMVWTDPRLARTPMIMLTSSAQRGEAAKTPPTGIVAYVTKPVRSAQLRNALNSALTSPTVADRGSSLIASTEDRGPASPAPTVVLLVEDNVVNQKVFTAMLATIGYRVDVAMNGLDGLEALGRQHYAAVFMDCQMPVMDGYQATKKLRQREGNARHTSVIAVTASAMATDRAACLEAGMDDFLTKPLRLKAVAAALDRWVVHAA